ERDAAGSLATQPGAQDAVADPLGRLVRQVEQDPQLGPVVELARDDRDRVDGQHLAQLVVGEREALHELDGGGGHPCAPRRRAQKSWFSPPKTSLTDRSLKMLRIESVSRSAHESWRMFEGAPGGSGIVSVTTICSKRDRLRFSKA